jgi:hypothetical protein
MMTCIDRLTGGMIRNVLLKIAKPDPLVKITFNPRKNKFPGDLILNLMIIYSFNRYQYRSC